MNTHWHVKSGGLGKPADYVDVASEQSEAIELAVQWLNTDLEREVRSRLRRNGVLHYRPDWVKPERYLEVVECEPPCPHYEEDYKDGDGNTQGSA